MSYKTYRWVLFSFIFFKILLSYNNYSYDLYKRFAGREVQNLIKLIIYAQNFIDPLLGTKINVVTFEWAATQLQFNLKESNTQPDTNLYKSMKYRSYLNSSCPLELFSSHIKITIIKVLLNYCVECSS